MPTDWYVYQRFLDIDGFAGTPAYEFNGELDSVEYLRYDVTNLAYFLPHRERVAVIGVGGGRDLLAVAHFGRRDITGIELNPIFVKLHISEPVIAEFSLVARLAGVRFVVDEARSWMARRTDNFDLIQMSLIDTWAATNAGAFTLSENGLYTREAWNIFLNRLSDNGIFTVSRWYSPDSIDETGRMVSLAVATLIDRGANNPRQHIFLAAQGGIATLVLSKRPLTRADVETLEERSAFYQHQIVLTPGVPPYSPTLANIVGASNHDELQAATRGLVLDLTPPTDERPFFFNQLPLHDPVQALRIGWEMLDNERVENGVVYGNLVATLTLITLFALSLLLVVLSILIPLRPAIKDVGSNVVIGGTAYFVLIGAGFMMIEIGLLQRMSVFLGHPVYALSVLLSTLVVSTSFGSLASERWPLDTRRKLSGWALMTGIYLLALPYWLPGVLSAFSANELAMRALICVATIAPGGLMMGFAFPTGLRLIAAIDKTPTPWFWGINGASGVLASVSAVAISLAFGITTTLTIGAVCYLLLTLTVLGMLPARGKT